MTWRSLFYAKVQIKSDKVTPFGGIIKIMELFNILFGNLTSFFRQSVICRYTMSHVNVLHVAPYALETPINTGAPRGATSVKTLHPMWHPSHTQIMLSIHFAQ